MLRSYHFWNAQSRNFKIMTALRYNCSDNKQTQITNENALQIIDKIVKDNKICLFMKGTPESPSCGYSNFVVQLLKRYGITDYKYVDILENNILREQVKVYSKWPTYPQLFICGDMIGGSDILNQMHKDQSLQQLLIEKGLI